MKENSEVDIALEAKIRQKVMQEIDITYTKGVYLNMPLTLIAQIEEFRFVDEKKGDFYKEAIVDLINKRKSYYNKE